MSNGQSIALPQMEVAKWAFCQMDKYIARPQMEVQCSQVGILSNGQPFVKWTKYSTSSNGGKSSVKYRQPGKQSCR